LTLFVVARKAFSGANKFAVTRFCAVLSEMQPFDEELIHAPSKRRPKIVDAIWTLYASAEFVDEMIGGNKQMKQAQRVDGANEGSQLLPGFQEEPSRGK